jgi:murein L,D-transpeptidase YcbB/YkuD
MFVSMNPIYTELRRGLMQYRQRWGALPRVPIPAGPALKAGSTGERVDLLRTRMGLTPGGGYDAALAKVVKEYQGVHGLKADGFAGAGTIESLNRGPQYYEQLIIINMERAKRLPAPEEERRYVVVDAGGARLSMWGKRPHGRPDEGRCRQVRDRDPDDGRLHQICERQSYWNVPPELVKNLIAPRVVAQGVSYLTEREYQVLPTRRDAEGSIRTPSTGRPWSTAPGSRLGACPARPIRWA